MMPLAIQVLDEAGRALGEALPRVAGAVLLLAAGLLAARLAARLLRRTLRATGVDRLAERWGVDRALHQVGIRHPLSEVTARLVRVVVSVVAAFAALSLLGLEFLSTSLNEAVLFLPQLLTGLAIVVVGIVVSGLVKELVDRAAWQMDFPIALGRLAQVAILAILGVTALTQVGVSTDVLTVLVNILLAAGALTLTLAFGLGGRDVARAVNAGRYVRGGFEVGETISFGGTRGRIAEIGAAATVLEAEGGRRLRVPNHLLIEAVVTVEPAEDEAETEGERPAGV